MGQGKPRAERATGVGAIATSITPTRPSQLESVRLHLSAVGGAVGAVAFTVTINSLAAAVYDTLLFSQDMTAVQDVFWQPDRAVTIMNGDTIDIAYANGSGLTYGLEVIYKTEF